ncbi:MAG: hypothetical protein ACREFK_11060 [Stellaceae bacterium]
MKFAGVCRAATVLTGVAVGPLALADCDAPHAHAAGASSPAATATIPQFIMLRMALLQKLALVPNTARIGPAIYGN